VRTLLILPLFIIFNSIGFCQSEINNKPEKDFLISKKKWTIEIPLWIQGFAGDFSYGDVSIKGEDGEEIGDPSDPDDDDNPRIIDRLFDSSLKFRFFYIGRVAYEKNKIMVMSDVIGGSVGSSLKFNYNDKEIVQVNFTSNNVRALLGYKFIEHYNRNKTFRYELFGYIGGRVHNQTIKSDLNNLINKLDLDFF